MNLDLELPFDPDPPAPPVRMSMERYMDFIEFNRRVLRENGLLEKMVEQRDRPVDRMFSLK